MDADQQKRRDKILDQASMLDPTSRVAFLDQICGSDRELRRDLEEALDVTRSAGDDFLSTRLLAITPAQDDDSASGTPLRLYRLLQRIAEGGMGEVWLGEQLRPLRRQVAIKLIRRGMRTRQVVARFESERQALALMDHPAIATVFDGGTTPDGRPYFAMEYVKGEPITTYCDRLRHSIEERLQLFIQVCEGVQHAHQKGIIHRDLKPSNVLVTVREDRVVPKIIDFGVAKAVAQPLTERTLYTELGSLIGTPAYMSPEQIGSGGLVDTRTDIYSLGVILYELLTGARPLDHTNLEDASLPELARLVADNEPPPPSKRAVALGGNVNEMAQCRRTEPHKLSGRLRGDLDWITMKALEKDRTRRYGTAAALVADVRHHLNHEPVVAGPPSTMYRTRKFVRRHRFGATVSAFAIGALLLTMTAIAAGARQAAQERDRAVAAEQTAKAVSDFLQHDLLAQAGADKQAGPTTKPDPDLKVRTALDRAAARIAGKFSKQPSVEASIQQTIGSAYQDLGVYREAEAHLNSALALRRQVLGDEHPDTLATMEAMATLYQRQGKQTQAESLHLKVLEVRRRVLGETHLDTLDTMNNLTTLYVDQGKYAQAEPLATTVLETRRRLLGDDEALTLAALNGLAVTYRGLGNFAKAEPLFTRALDIQRRVLGEAHSETLATMNNLGYLYLQQGKHADAELLATKALDIRLRILGEEHPDTVNSMNNVSVGYVWQGKYAQAEPLATKALEIQRRTLGEEHPNVLAFMYNLGNLYLWQGKYAQAEPLLMKALAIQRRALPAEHPHNPRVLMSLGELRLRSQRYSSAESLLREALSIDEKTNSDSWERYLRQSFLGASLTGQKNYAAAEPLLLSGYNGMLARQAMIPPFKRLYLQQAGVRIAQLYQDWGKPDLAAEWRKRTALP